MRLYTYIKEFISQFYKDNDKPSILFGLIVVWPLFGFLPALPKIILYSALVFYALYSIPKVNKISLLYSLFLIYIPLNLITTNPPELFRSWERYIIFALVLFCFSPLLLGKAIERRHITLFRIILGASVFIGVGSFFARFLGINYMTATLMDYIYSVGTFGGLTPHSMLLGIVAAIGAIFLSYKALMTKKLIFWILAFLCLGSVLFSDSRSALMATLVGYGILIIKITKASKSVSILISIALSFCVLYAILPSALDGIIKKNKGNIESVDLSSRQNKWDARIAEFNQDPIFGIGFASVDPKNTNDYNFDGGIESGSSWLSVLSMTGIVGAIFIILIFYHAIRKLLKVNTPPAKLLLALLCLFMTHMIAEGYIFYGGGVLCMSLWLILGCATEIQTRKLLFNSQNIKVS